MDLDWEVRLAAFYHLNHLRERSGGFVGAAEMQTGVEFHGQRVPLFNQPVGIWRPAPLGQDGAALSLTTAPPKAGAEPPYDDDIASNEDWLVYRYQREGPQNWMNKAVTRAMDLERPIIYFYGVVTKTYEALYPLYVIADDPQAGVFRLSYSALAARALDAALANPADGIQRSYAIREVKVRLHQHRFRELVLHAYQSRCAVCRIRHDPLLDAAHILPDRDERGHPEVPNGLALCKIHHAAFDTDILGISTERVVHIRHDILDEHDGPMLQHGIKEMHGEQLRVPKNPSLQPNADYLAERFSAFLAA